MEALALKLVVTAVVLGCFQIAFLIWLIYQNNKILHRDKR